MASKPPSDAPFWVTPTLKDRKTWVFIKEMKRRQESLLHMIPYALAVELHKGLLARLPNKADFEEYRKSLHVVRVAGGNEKKEVAYSVYAMSKARRIKKTDVGKTVIYVRQNKSKNTPSNPSVKILEDRGPWTADTIPFWPGKDEAVVVQRKQERRAVDKVAAARKKEWPKVRREFEKVGIRMPTKKKGPGQVKRNQQKAVPDLAMLANSLEFGLGSRKSNPAWRQLLKLIMGMIKKLPLRERHILNAWTNPNDHRWETWPTDPDKISIAKAQDCVGWQEKLGY